MRPLGRLVLTAMLTAIATAQAPVSVTGRVVDPGGKPIANARIAIAGRYDLDTPALLTSGKQPDAEGSFVIAATPSDDEQGPRFLYVAAPGRAAIRQRIRWQKPAFGELILPVGKRLVGRVRQPDGTALAEVRVIATDLLETTRALRTDTRHGFFCSAPTDAAGIFQLPCALPNAMALEFGKPGFARTWREPVAIGAPLEVELQPTGWIAGRVLDDEGRSVALARVTVAYELRATEQSVTTDEGGSFRVPLEREGRWRLTARHESAAGTRSARSNVLRGPRANLEILLAPPEAPTTRHLLVRAETTAGEPVRGFRATAVWDDFANRNIAFREFRLRQRLAGVEPATDGVAKIVGPPARGAKAGCIRVVAPGFAPATVADHEWHDPEPGEPGEPLVVTLQPEAHVRGQVRDSETGAPIAGARVRARFAPKTARSQYPDRNPKDGVTTAADGTFDLRGLGSGRWRLTVDHESHAPARPVYLELENGEARDGVTLELPPGATVRGSVTGIQLGSGTLALLAPLPRTSYSAAGRNRFGTPEPTRERRLDASAEFEFTGIPLGNYQLVLRLPSRPRLGGDLFLPIEPFRVRATGIDREFDCNADRPGRITGRLAFSHASASPENLIVIAEPARTEQPPASTNMRFRGPRSFVTRDLRFDVRAGPGDYFLYVADLETGLTLHTEPERVALGASKSVTRDLTVELARIDLALAAAPGVERPADVDRIEIRFAPRDLPNIVANLGSNPNYDSQRGLHWPRGAERRTLVLPPGTALFYARNGVRHLRHDRQRHTNPPLGIVDLEIEAGREQPIECRLELDEAPEIPDAAEAEPEIGDADATGRVK
ncbi:MAG: carboxypeptidase-like regulatory domain-containing protein [bacterium]|nr:carboxypeptidase-like regulatory domain-containing protein [bacterium]